MERDTGKSSSAAMWLAAGCSELPSAPPPPPPPPRAKGSRPHNKARDAQATCGYNPHLNYADAGSHAGSSQSAAARPPTVPRGGWAHDQEGWSTTAAKSWYHPRHYKKRFCAWYPDSTMCRRGDGCAFAHSREEVRAPLLSEAEEAQDPVAMTDEFFMYKFKVYWCPIGVQHNWQNCVYAHNYQDSRRDVAIGYGSTACPHWNRHETGAEYWQRCPAGVHCPYAHGAKETLYHPDVFRTAICRDRCDKSLCPRQRFCAFFHGKNQLRKPAVGRVDYRQPLPAENMDAQWLDDFLTQPFPPGENALTPSPMEIAMAEHMWQSYAAASMASAPPPWIMGADIGGGLYDRFTTPYKGLEAAPALASSHSPRTQSTASSERGVGEGGTDEELYLWAKHWSAMGAGSLPQFHGLHGRGF